MQYVRPGLRPTVVRPPLDSGTTLVVCLAFGNCSANAAFPAPRLEPSWARTGNRPARCSPNVGKALWSQNLAPRAGGHDVAPSSRPVQTRVPSGEKVPRPLPPRRQFGKRWSRTERLTGKEKSVGQLEQRLYKLLRYFGTIVASQLVR